MHNRYDPRVVLVAFTPEEAFELADLALSGARYFGLTDVEHRGLHAAKFLSALHGAHQAYGEEVGRRIDTIVAPYRPVMLAASGVDPSRWMPEQLDRLEAALAEVKAS